MDLEYAHAKLQSLEAETYFIRTLPTTLGRKTTFLRTSDPDDICMDKIRIHECQSMYPIHPLANLTLPQSQESHCQINYNGKEDKFFVSPLGAVYVDNQLYEPEKIFLQNANEETLTGLKERQIFLRHLSQIYFPCENCVMPHLFYFILPDKTKEGNKSKRGSIFTPTRISCTHHTTFTTPLTTNHRRYDQRCPKEDVIPAMVTG